MDREGRRALLSSGLYTLLIVVLLAGGGFYVRSLVANSFETARALQETRGVAFDALKYQLDEETGLRGFAATGKPLFLQPYLEALGPFQADIRTLRIDLSADGIPEATTRVEDIAEINADYLRTVAAPLLQRAANQLPVQVHGKALIDRFRVDVAEIDSLLTERELLTARAVQTSLDRISLLVGAAVVIVLLLSLIYAVQRTSLAARLERERLEVEVQRRDAAVLRSAYEAEKRIADTLQGAFVQRPLPRHPTLRFSATYVPATEESRVGGDWYDAIELPGGRVLFAIGDVTGHGIDAAVTMNRVRQALITSALVEAEPAGVLSRVARELHAEQTPLVTAVVGFADANTYEFVYAAAGHPPPLLVEPGRQPHVLPPGSLPLGAVANPEYRNVRIQSVPGATLVLYTDGAIEHSRDVIEGERLLIEAAAAAAAQSGDAAAYIHSEIFAARPAGDDVAILTVGFGTAGSLDVNVDGAHAQNTAPKSPSCEAGTAFAPPAASLRRRMRRAA